MSHVNALQHQWRTRGVLDVRRDTRFVLVSTFTPAQLTPFSPPTWSTLTLVLDPHTALFVEHGHAVLSASPRQHDELRITRLDARRLLIRRDGLGRALLLGTRLEAGIALGNDADYLASRSHPLRARASRYAAHLSGWDRHDLGEHDFLEGLWRLLPGHSCIIEQGVRHPQVSWWAEDVRDWHAHHGHDERASDLLDLLDDALHLIPQPTGLAVSSGLDSTLLAAHCHEHHTPLVLGTMSFPGLASCDETDRVHAWTHTMSVPGAHCFDMTRVSPWSEPHTFSSLGPQSHPGEGYERVFASRFASSQGLATLMTGVGADQLFEVDPWHVVNSIVSRGQWRELDAPHWRALVESRGRYRLMRDHLMQGAWHAFAPPSWRYARLRAQISESPNVYHTDIWLDDMTTSLLARDETWGTSEERVTRRRVLKSWAWESLVRSLWRLERSAGVSIHTPFLSEPLWRWGVWLSPTARMSGFGGYLFNKFLLRTAHARYAHLFPERFARRGKAAVFDEHIRRGMMGSDREQVLEVLGLIEDEKVRTRAHALWRRVESGAVGRDLVELCRIFSAERWRQSV